MRINAAVLRAADAPYAIEQVQLNDPGPGEILVRITGVGQCHTDLLGRTGLVGMPVILGHEGSGTIAAAGPGVTGLAVGDHVVLSFDSCGACTNCRAAHPAYCAEFFARNLSGLAVDGSTPAAGEDGKPVAARWFAQSSFASHAVVTVRNVVRVDPDLPCHSCSSRASSTCGNGAGSRSTDSSPGTRSTRSTRPKPTPPAERPSNPY